MCLNEEITERRSEFVAFGSILVVLSLEIKLGALLWYRYQYFCYFPVPGPSAVGTVRFLPKVTIR